MSEILGKLKESIDRKVKHTFSFDNIPLDGNHLQLYVLLQILEKLESIDDSLISIMHDSTDAWNSRNNRSDI